MATTLEELFMIVTAIAIALIAYGTYKFIIAHYGTEALERTTTDINQASYKVISPLDGAKVPVYYVESSNGTILKEWFYMTVASTMDNLDELDAMPISIVNTPIKDIEVYKIGSTIINGVKYTVYRVKVYLPPSYKGGILSVNIKNSGVTLVGYMTEVKLVIVFPINNTEVYLGDLPIKIKNTGEDTKLTDIKTYIDGNLVYSEPGLNITLGTGDVYTYYITTSTLKPGKHTIKVIINNGEYAYTLNLLFKRRPTIVLTDVKLTYRNDINGTIFNFTAKLKNEGSNIIIISPGTYNLYLGETPLNNLSISKTIVNPGDTFEISGIKRLVSPGDSVIKVSISNYETNSLPITIPLVQNIYLINSSLKINIMNLTIRNTGNRYFIFNSIRVIINGRDTRIVSTPPLGKYINIMSNFIVSIDTTGLIPGRTYPITIIVNKNIKWTGNIYIPYDREIVIMNVTASEETLNVGVKYLGNTRLYYRKGTLIFKLTNSTTPTIYLLTDDYSLNVTNFKPKTSFELNIINEPIAHWFDNGNSFQVTAEIPFPLAGTYLVNFTVNKGYSDEANGYGTFLVFSIIKGINKDDIPYSTEYVNTTILQPQYVVNSEDDVNQQITQKLSKTNVRLYIYSYNMIKKVIVSGYLDNVPSYINEVNINEPRIQPIEIVIRKDIPDIHTPSMYMNDLSGYINEKLQTESPVKLKYRLLANYTLPNFNPTMFNMSSLTIVNENIQVNDNILPLWYDTYGGFTPYHKVGWIDGVSYGKYRYSIVYLVNYLPDLLNNGNTYVSVPYEDFAVITPITRNITIESIKLLMNKPVNVVSENNVLNIINEKLQPTTNYEFMAYSPVWRYREYVVNRVRNIVTTGVPTDEYATFVIIENPLYIDVNAPEILYNNINLHKTNYIVRVNMDNEKDKHITIYDTKSMNMYINPYNISLEKPYELTINPSVEFVTVNSKRIDYVYRDLRQLTFYSVVVYNNKIPYIKLRPTNYTALNRVNIIQTLPLPSPVDIRLKMIYDYTDTDTSAIDQINYNNIISQVTLIKDVIPYIVPALKSYYIYNAFHYYYPIPFIYSVIGYNSTSNMYRMYIYDKEYIPSYIRVYRVQLNNTFVGKEGVNYLSISLSSVTAKAYNPILVPTLFIETTKNYPINLEHDEIPFIAVFTDVYYHYDNKTYTMYVPYISLDKEIKAEVVGKIIQIYLNKDIYNEQPYFKSGEVPNNITIEPNGDILSTILISKQTVLINYKLRDTTMMKVVHMYLILPVPTKIEVGSLTNYIIKPNSFVGKLVMYAININETVNTNYITPSISSQFDNMLSIILLTDVNVVNGIKVSEYRSIGVNGISITTMPIFVEYNMNMIGDYTHNLLLYKSVILYSSQSFQ